MDKLLFGLSVTAIGMLVVFVGLVILIGCVKGISVFGKGGKRSKLSKETEKAPAPAALVEIAAPDTAFGGIAPEIVAAITAALAAVWEGEKGFVVRHIKRVNNAPAWNRAGREEQTYSRF